MKTESAVRLERKACRSIVRSHLNHCNPDECWLLIEAAFDARDKLPLEKLFIRGKK